MPATTTPYPTHFIRRNAWIWDTTPDQDGGCFRQTAIRLTAYMTENRSAKIFTGDYVEFETDNGRTVWADETAYSPIC